MTLSPNRGTYAGLALITLATIMFEILLTRVFSATMWYHFAFMAISVAMFGMTAGAILVYRLPALFPAERTADRLAQASALFGITLAIAFLVYLQIPHKGGDQSSDKIVLPLTFLLISVPFVFSGVAVTLALTRFPARISSLYAVDLAGAALGCVLLLLVLRVTDVYTAVVICALLGIVSALAFLGRGATRGLRVALIVILTAGLSFAAVNTWLAAKQKGLIRLKYIKALYEPIRPAYEGWNSYSRVSVWPADEANRRPFGWGMSRTLPEIDPSEMVEQHYLFIDGGANTVITAFDGDVSKVDYLKYDITNLAHYLSDDADVLVVGVGGGRDILSAIVFGQKFVTGVELNSLTVGLLEDQYADLTGRLGERPDVTLHADEARSFIARSDTSHDIIMVSLIDTWAATAAGAFVLSESALYTREAWDLFLDHINPGGFLSFSRWWSPQTAAESYRIVSLAAASLESRGAANPQNHILLARTPGTDAGLSASVSTILVSPTPIPGAIVDRFEDVCNRLEFDVLVSPRVVNDATIAGLLDPARREAVCAEFPLDITPPVDSDPFFFHTLRLRDIFNRDLLQSDTTTFNLRAVRILGILLFTVILLSVACILLPLLFTTEKGALSGASPLMIYFAGIGLGFMLVELSLMQRLIIFLGHPVYSLSVVLFTLLVAGGLGSWLTERVSSDTIRSAGLMRFAGLFVALVISGLAVGPVVAAFEGAITPVRILLGAALVFVPGVFMGMCFPLGMKAAVPRHEHLTPWFWGINGAFSVLASVLSVAIALAADIPAAYWTGVACYVVTLGAFVGACRQHP